MPFKANAPRRHHIPKQRRRVTNWAEYDAALRQRGSLTVWFTEAAIAAWEAEPRTTPGGQPHYSSLAITTALTLKAVFRLALGTVNLGGAWRGRLGRVGGRHDTRSQVTVRRLPLSGRGHQPHRLALLPLSAEPAHGRRDAGRPRLDVSHETVRQWARKFGQGFANQIRR